MAEPRRDEIANLEAVSSAQPDARIEQEQAAQGSGARCEPDAGGLLGETDRGPGGEEPGEAPVVTETIADLYAQQGLQQQAADVYRELLQDRPGDERLLTKLAGVEASPAPDDRAAAANGPTIREHLRVLLAWRPLRPLPGSAGEVPLPDSARAPFVGGVVQAEASRASGALTSESVPGTRTERAAADTAGAVDRER